jgi:hypothetical protein
MMKNRQTDRMFLAVGLRSARTEYACRLRRCFEDSWKAGDFKDSVLKTNIPRNDLKVTIVGIGTPTLLASRRARDDQK